MPKKTESTVAVRVRPGRILRTHPRHVDGLRAPDAETLAATGGIDGPETIHREGETAEVPAEAVDELERAGIVERV